MQTARIIALRLFVIALAIWLGGGLFQVIEGHLAWYSDPVAWIRGGVAQAGAMNPWPITTAFVGVTTLVTLGLFALYRGPGWREVLAASGITLVILFATGIYFVPTLIMLSGHELLSNAQIIDASRMWIGLNVVRMVVLLAVMHVALVAVGRLGPRLSG